MSDDHLKNKIRNKLCWRASLSALIVLVLGALGSSVWAAPQGGRITRGDGRIEQRGTHTDIYQQSDFLATRWNSFNIGAHESARAHQPNVNSRLLIRVDGGGGGGGGGATSIAGSYISNGITIIENQNGVQFSRGSVVNVGGLLATSSRLSGLAGSRWQLNGAGGDIVNHGKITSGAGGVVLAAVKVHNTGDIISHGGDVALGAGSSFTVDFAGGLVGFEVEGAALGANIASSGKIEALGGIVKLSAQEAQNVRANVVSVGGVVKATQIERRGGVVYLSGGAQGIAAVSGSVQADDKIETTGKYIVVKEGTTLKAPEILVGGDFQGQGDVPTAQRTLVEMGALLDAGQHGRVIVWADETTWFHGDINAPKGFAEVSGKLNLAAVNLPGINVGSGDDAGTLLLDPDYIIIGGAGADITGSIVFTAPPVNETNTLSADSINRFTGNLMLQASIAMAVDAPINKLTGDLSLFANTQLRLNHHITLGTGRLTLTGGPGLHGVSLGGNIQLAGMGVVITGGINETGTTISPFGVGGNNSLTITSQSDITLHSNIDLGSGTLSLNAGLSDAGDDGNVINGGAVLLAAGIMNLTQDAQFGINAPFTLTIPTLNLTSRSAQTVRAWMTQGNPHLTLTSTGVLTIGANIDNGSGDLTLNGASINLSRNIELSGETVTLTGAIGLMTPANFSLTITASKALKLSTDINLGSGDLNVMAQMIKVSSPRTLTANLIDIKFTGAGITTLEHGIAVSLDNPDTEPLNEFVSGKDLMVYVGATIFEFAAINEMCAVSCTLNAAKESRLDANKITATGDVTLDVGTDNLTFTGTGAVMITANNIKVIAAQIDLGTIDLGTRALILNASINSSGGGSLTLNAEIIGAGNDGAVMLSADGNLAINRDILLGGTSSDGSAEGFGRALTLRGGEVIVGGSGERQVRGGSVSLTAIRSSRQHTAALKVEAFTGDLTLSGSLNFGTKSLTLLAASDDGDILFSADNPTTLIGGDVMLQSGGGGGGGGGGAQAATNQNLTITASGGLLTLNQDIDVGSGRLELSSRSFSLSGLLTLTAAHVLLGQAHAFSGALFTVEADHLILRTEADQEIQPWMIEEQDRSLFISTAGNLIAGRDINLAADINLQGAMISFTGSREIIGHNILLASTSLVRPAPSGVMSSDKDLTIHASGIFALRSDIHLGSGSLKVMAQAIQVFRQNTLTANLIDIKFTGAGIATLEHGIAASFDNPNTEPLNEFVSGKDLIMYAGATIFEFAALNEMCAVSCALNATEGSLDANKITATGSVILDAGTSPLTFTGTGAIMITASNIEVIAAQLDLGTRALMLNASASFSDGGNLTLNTPITADGGGGGDGADGAVLLSAGGNLAINQDIDVGSFTLELSARDFLLSNLPTLTAARVLLEQASAFDRPLFAVAADHLTLKTAADQEIQAWMIEDRDRSLSVITTGNLIVGRDINLAADIDLQGAMISSTGRREIAAHDVLLTSISSAQPAPSDADLILLAQRDLTIAAVLNVGSGALRLTARSPEGQRPDQPSAIIFAGDAELLGRLIILDSEEAITTNNHDLTIRAGFQLSVIGNRGINAGTGDLILAVERSTLDLDPNQTLMAANITLEQNALFGARAPVKFAFTTTRASLSLHSRASEPQQFHAWMAAPNRSLTLRSRGHIFLDEFSVFDFGTGSLTLHAGFDSALMREIRFSSEAKTEIEASRIKLIAGGTFSEGMQDIVLTSKGVLKVLTPLQTSGALTLTGNTIFFSFFGESAASRLDIEGGQISLVARNVTDLPNQRSVEIKSSGDLNITGGLNVDIGGLRLIAGDGEGAGAINFIGRATALKGRDITLIADLAPRAGDQSLAITAGRNINVNTDIDLGAGDLTLKASVSDETGAINFNPALQTELKSRNISLSSAAQSHAVNQRVVMIALDDLTINSSLDAGRRGELVLLAGARAGAGVGRLSLATSSAVELIGRLIQLEGQQAPLTGRYGLKIVSYTDLHIYTDLTLARNGSTILHLEAGRESGSGEVKFLRTRTLTAHQIVLRQYGAVFGARPLKALIADDVRLSSFSLDDQPYYSWMGSARGQDLYLHADGNIIVSSDIALGAGDLALSAGRAIILPARARIVSDETLDDRVLSGGNITLIAASPIVAHDHHLTIKASRALKIDMNIDAGAGDLTLKGGTISFDSHGRSVAGILDITGANIIIDAARVPLESLNRAVRIHAAGDLQIHGGLNAGTGNLHLLAGGEFSRGALNFASATTLIGADIFLSAHMPPRASDHALTIRAGNHLYIRTDINTGAAALTLTTRTGAINFNTERATSLTGGAITLTGGTIPLTPSPAPLVSNQALTITTSLGHLNINGHINSGAGDLTLTSAAAINFNPAHITRLKGRQISLTAARDSSIRHRRIRIEASQDININVNLNTGRGDLILISTGGAINFDPMGDIMLSGNQVSLIAAAPSLMSPKSLAIAAIRDINIHTDLNTGTGDLTLIAGRSGQPGALRFNTARATTLTGSTITLTASQEGANHQNLTLNASVDLKLNVNLNVGRAALELSAGQEMIFPRKLVGQQITLTKGGLPIAAGLGVKFFSMDELRPQVAINYTGTGKQILHDWMVAGRQTMHVSVNGILVVSGNFDAGLGDIFLSAKGGIRFVGDVNLRGHHIELISLLASPPSEGFLDVGAAGDLTLTGQFNSGSGFMRLEAGMGAGAGALNFGAASSADLRAARIDLISDQAPLASHQNLTITSARDINIHTDINIGAGALVLTAAMGDRQGLINFNTARATTLTAAAITLTTPLADGATSLRQAAQPAATRQDLTLVAQGDVNIGANLNLGSGDLNIRAADNLIFSRTPHVIADRVLLMQDNLVAGADSLMAMSMTASEIELILTNSASASQALEMITSAKSITKSISLIIRVMGDLNINGDIILASARSLTLEAGYGTSEGAINFLADATLTAHHITLLADRALAKNNNAAVRFEAERNLNIGANLDVGARALTLMAGGAINFTALRPITLAGGAITLSASALPAPSRQSLKIAARNNLIINAGMNIGAGDLVLRADGAVSFSGAHFIGARSITLSQGGQVWVDNLFTGRIGAAAANISLSTDQISFIYTGSSDDQRVQDWMMGSADTANVSIRSAGDLTVATNLDLGERDLTLKAGKGNRTGALVFITPPGADSRRIVLRARDITLSANKVLPSLSRGGSLIIRAANNLTVTGKLFVSKNLILAAGAELSFGIGQRSSPTGIATAIQGLDITLLAGMASILKSGKNLTIMSSGDLNIGADIDMGAGDLLLYAGLGIDRGAINIVNTAVGARAIALTGHRVTLISKTAPLGGNGQNLSITASGNLIINADINLIDAAGEASTLSPEIKLSAPGTGKILGYGTLTASVIELAQAAAFDSADPFGESFRLNGSTIRFISDASFSIRPWMIARASNAHLYIHAAGDLAVLLDNITLAANQDLTLSAGGALNFRTAGAVGLKAHNIILAAGAAPVMSRQALILEAFNDINIGADLDTGSAALTLNAGGAINFNATAQDTRALTLKGGVITLTAPGASASFLMGGPNLTITAARDLNIRANIQTGAGALTLTAGHGETSGAINFGGERHLIGRAISLAADMLPSASHGTLILMAREDINIGASMNAGSGKIVLLAGRGRLTGALNFTASVSLSGYRIRLRTDGSAPAAGNNFDVTVDAMANIDIHTDINTGTGNLTLRAREAINFIGEHRAFVSGGMVSLTSPGARMVNKNITITAMDNLILDTVLATSAAINLTSINGAITARKNLTAQDIAFTQGQVFGESNPFGAVNIFSSRIALITTNARAQNVYDWMTGLTDGPLIIRAAQDINVNSSMDLSGRALVLNAGYGGGTGAINWSGAQNIELTADSISLAADQAARAGGHPADAHPRLIFTARHLLLESDVNVGTSDLTINVDLLELSRARAMLLTADNITVNAMRVLDSQGQNLTIQARRDLTLAAPLDVDGGTLFLEAGYDSGAGVIIFSDPSLALTAANITLKQDRAPFGGDQIAPVALVYEDGLTINYDGSADQPVQDWMSRARGSKNLTLISRGSLSIQRDINAGSHDLTLMAGGAINFANTRAMSFSGSNITFISSMAGLTAASDQNLTINADGNIVMNARINLGSGLLTLIAGGDISGNGMGTLTAARIRLSQNEMFAQTAPFALAAGALTIEAHTAPALEHWMVITGTDLNFMSTGDIQIAGDYDLGAGDLTLTAIGALNLTAATKLAGNHISLNAARAASAQDHDFTLIAQGDLNINTDIHIGMGALKLTGGAIQFSSDRQISLMGGEMVLTSQRAPMANHHDLFITATTLTLMGGTALNVGDAMIAIDLATPMLGSSALTARHFDLNFLCAPENCMAYRSLQDEMRRSASGLHK